MTQLFKINIGETNSAVDSGDQFVEVRESRGKFYVQENTRDEENKIINQQGIGRPRRDGAKAVQRARERVDNSIEGVDTVDIERQVPNGKYAPEGTEPDASVPPDRGPEGRFVSGRRVPVDSFGRQERDGRFTRFGGGIQTPSREQQEGDAFELQPSAADADLFTDEEQGALSDEFGRAADSFEEISRDDRETFFDTAAEIKRPFADVGLDDGINADGLAVDTTNTLLDRRR